MMFNTEFDDALEMAKSDPDAAAKALLLVAKYLRMRDLPPRAALFLIDAIEGSMRERPSKRGPALLKRLMLTAGHRRRVRAHWEWVGRDFDRLIESGDSQNSAASSVAADYDISEATAVRLWKMYRQIEDANEWQSLAECEAYMNGAIGEHVRDDTEPD